MSILTRCYVALGSNLCDPLHQVEQALQHLARSPGIHLRRRSPWCRSRAVGPGQQPDYVNGVVELETSLAAEALLAVLQGIERQQGRVRDEHWGPRTLDLDLLLYGDALIDTSALQVPHPRLAERVFVLAPLATLAADRHLPGRPSNKGKSATIAALLSALPPEEGLCWLENPNEAVPL